MSPKQQIGIVIPAYNAGTYVLDAAASAEAALGAKRNIVVVDDGSDQRESLEALRILERDGFTVHRQPNSGVSVARNTGIGLLDTPYAFTLDADDMIHPTAPATAVTALSSDESVAIATGTMIEFDELGNRWTYAPTEQATRDGMRHETRIHIASAFRVDDWRRTEGFPAGVHFGEDWVFWMRLLRLRPNVHRSSSTFCLRRRHSGQVTAQYINPIDSSRARLLVMRENPDLVASHIDEFIDAFDTTLTTLSAYRHAYRRIDALKSRARIAIGWRHRTARHGRSTGDEQR